MNLSLVYNQHPHQWVNEQLKWQQHYGYSSVCIFKALRSADFRSPAWRRPVRNWSESPRLRKDPGRIPEGSRMDPGRIPERPRKDPGETPEIAMKETHYTLPPQLLNPIFVKPHLFTINEFIISIQRTPHQWVNEQLKWQQHYGYPRTWPLT